MRMIAIIDYDAGNIKSVEKALKYLGEDAVITRDREEILSADKVILPGVGAFGDAMYNLKKYGLDEVLREVAKRQIPLLGICLGIFSVVNERLPRPKEDFSPATFSKTRVRQPIVANS